jgi:hypothetical protein
LSLLLFDVVCFVCFVDPLYHLLLRTIFVLFHPLSGLLVIAFPRIRIVCCLLPALSSTSEMLRPVILFVALWCVCGSAQLNCTPLPASNATNVRNLHPNVCVKEGLKYCFSNLLQDIKVIMALGDSITAGKPLYILLCLYPLLTGFSAFGLDGFKGVIKEFRGQSFAIGGDSDAVTLANFLKYLENEYERTYHVL